jgi:hypothetical protein
VVTSGRRIFAIEAGDRFDRLKADERGRNARAQLSRSNRMDRE